MSTRITIDQLEKMKTHELADLLANVVLLLRRMPDVECRDLVQQFPTINFSIEREAAQPATVSGTPVSLTPDELKKKNVTELKKIANDLHIPAVSKLKKDELVSKILARNVSGRSEQFAIRDL